MHKKIDNEKYYRNRSIHRLKILGVIVAILAVIVCIFMFMYRVKEIKVDGNERYSDEEIIEALDADDAFNTLIYYYGHKDIHTISGMKYIDNINISTPDRNTIYIDVVEKVIVGCINDEGIYMYFDKSGTILESSTSRDESIPLITGEDFGNLEVGKHISASKDRNYDVLLELTLLLMKYEINIEEIIYDDGKMTLSMGDVKAALGDGAHLEERISVLKDILPELENLTGTLDLENYNMVDDPIVFHKEVQNIDN